MGAVVEMRAFPSGRRTTPTSTPFAGPTTTSFRRAPRCFATTFSKKARLTLPISYLGFVTSDTSKGLQRVSWADLSPNSLRRHDPDQVPRVYPSRGILSAPQGLPV